MGDINTNIREIIAGLTEEDEEDEEEELRGGGRGGGGGEGGGGGGGGGRGERNVIMLVAVIPYKLYVSIIGSLILVKNEGVDIRYH